MKSEILNPKQIQNSKFKCLLGRDSIPFPIHVSATPLLIHLSFVPEAFRIRMVAVDYAS
jgi:hypothetical protein